MQDDIQNNVTLELSPIHTSDFPLNIIVFDIKITKTLSDDIYPQNKLKNWMNLVSTKLD